MTTETLSYRLEQASSFMLLNENVTHLLDCAVDGADYPMQVNVSIDIEPPEPVGTCEYEDCENDAQTVVLFEDIDVTKDFCTGHAGVSVQRHDDAVTMHDYFDTEPEEDN